MSDARLTDAEADFPLLASGREWTADDHRRLQLSLRSFTTQGVVTLVLYFVFWLPGLLANIVWLREAKSIEREIGKPPQGKGLLTGLLLVFAFLPILIAVGAIIYVLVSVTGRFPSPKTILSASLAIAAVCLILVGLMLRGSRTVSEPSGPWNLDDSGTKASDSSQRDARNFSIGLGTKLLIGMGAILAFVLVTFVSARMDASQFGSDHTAVLNIETPSAASIAPSTLRRTLVGSLFLYGDYKGSEGDSCTGYKGNATDFTGIRYFAQLTLRDDRGILVGVSFLSEGALKWSNGGSTSYARAGYGCSFEFSFNNVPVDSTKFTLSAPWLVPVVWTQKELVSMDWVVRLTAGE